MGTHDAEQYGNSTAALDRLTRGLLTLERPSVHDVLSSAAAHMAVFSTFGACGILQTDPQRNRLETTHWSGPHRLQMILDGFVAEHADAIRDGLHRSAPVQIQQRGSADNVAWFIGIPIDDTRRPAGMVALLHDRAANDDEVRQIILGARFVSMALQRARDAESAQHQHANQSPVNLIALVAHELRTPLTGVRGNTQLAMMAIRRGQMEKVGPRLEAAIASVDSMTSLVQNLLDVSRLERGVYQLSPTRRDLRATLGSAIERATSAQSLKPRTITFLDGPPCITSHDPKSLEQALFYLTQTTTHYAAAGSDVTVELRADDEINRATVDLRYEGETFSVDDQRRLFEPFDFASRQTAGQHSDYLGLELALCRGIVAHHGGEIEIHSQDNRQRVTLRFPIHTSA
jgi:signal transduction histidine kinase